jgi:hypothetical protein
MDFNNIKVQIQQHMSRSNSASDDTVVASVISSFQERSRAGQMKYGTTLDRTDLTPLLMDAILYLERLKREMVTRNLHEK